MKVFLHNSFNIDRQKYPQDYLFFCNFKVELEHCNSLAELKFVRHKKLENANDSKGVLFEQYVWDKSYYGRIFFYVFNLDKNSIYVTNFVPIKDHDKGVDIAKRTDLSLSNFDNDIFDAEEEKKLYENFATEVKTKRQEIPQIKLTEQQKKLATLPTYNAIFSGIAGSGKTTICEELIRKVAEKKASGLYVTFSNSLVEKTIRIKLDFLQEIDEIIANFDSFSKLEIEKKLRISLINSDKKLILQELKRIRQSANALVVCKPNEIMLKIEQRDENFIKTEKDVFAQFYREVFSDYNLQSKNLDIDDIFKDVNGIIMGLLPELDDNSANQVSRCRKGHYNYLIDENYYISEQNQHSNFLDKNLRKSIYYCAKQFCEYVLNNSNFDSLSANVVAIQILNRANLKNHFDYAIIDEMQDLTEVQLSCLNHIAEVCVLTGDIFQMVNLNYFDINRVKKIFNVSTKTENLKINYRNPEKIKSIIDNFKVLRQNYLGAEKKATEDLDLEVEKIETDNEVSNVCYCDNVDVINKLASIKDIDYCVVVDKKDEDACKKIFKNIDPSKIRTIEKIKGLEDGFVLVYNLSNSNKNVLNELYDLNQKFLNKQITNYKKSIDYNSYFSYPFHALYVALTRSKNHLLVVEEHPHKIFKNFYDKNFERLKNVDIDNLQAMFDLKIEFKQWLEKYEKAYSSDDIATCQMAEKIAINNLKDEHLAEKARVYVRLRESGNYRNAVFDFLKIDEFDEAQVMCERINDNDFVSRIGSFIELLKNDEEKAVDKNIKNILNFYLDNDENAEMNERILNFVKQKVEKVIN